jgi:hypothetical protein
MYVYVGIEVDIRAYNAALKACLVSGSDELVEKGIQLFAEMMQNKVATAPPNLTSVDMPHHCRWWRWARALLRLAHTCSSLLLAHTCSSLLRAHTCSGLLRAHTCSSLLLLTHALVSSVLTSSLLLAHTCSHALVSHMLQSPCSSSTSVDARPSQLATGG